MESLAPQPRVLYVEDSVVNARLMSRVFACFRPDLRLDVAVDGKSGLEMLVTLRPDLLLLDFHLPDTTGVVMLEAIRRAGNELPVIVITADARPELAAAVLAAGGNGTVTKPFKFATVLDMVEAQLPQLATTT